jgi:hypothetical protein
MKNGIYLKGSKTGISKGSSYLSASHNQYLVGTCCEDGSYDLRRHCCGLDICLIITILPIIGAIGSTVLIVLKEFSLLPFPCPWYLAFIPLSAMLVIASLCSIFSFPPTPIPRFLSCPEMKFTKDPLTRACMATFFMILAAALIMLGLKLEEMVSWTILGFVWVLSVIVGVIIQMVLALVWSN